MTSKIKRLANLIADPEKNNTYCKVDDTSLSMNSALPTIFIQKITEDEDVRRWFIASIMTKCFNDLSEKCRFLMPT